MDSAGQARPQSRPALAERTGHVAALARRSSWQRAVALAAEIPAELRDARLQDAALAAFSRSRRWREVLGLVPLSPSTSSCNVALAACQRARRWKLALHLAQVPSCPDLQTYNAAIAAYSAAPAESAGAAALVAALRAEGYQPDQVTYNSWAKACARSDGWQAAVRVVFQEADKVDAVAATAAASAVSGRWRSALACVCGLKLRGSQSDTTLLNTAISSCSTATLWQPALQILQDLVCPSGLHHPDIVTCNTVITACGRGEQGSRVMKLLAALENWSLKANQITLNSLLSACDGRGDWVMAMSLLQRQSRRSVKADTASLTACLGATGRSSQWVAAQALLASSNCAGLRGDRHAVSVGVLAGSRGFAWNSALLYVTDIGTAVLDWTGHWEAAAVLWEFFGSKGMESSTDASNSVLGAHRAQWPRALHHLHAARRLRLADQASFNAAMSTCCGTRSWHQALCWLDESHHRLVTIKEDVMVGFNTAMSCCESIVTWTRSLDLLNALLEAAAQPDQKSYRSPIRMAGCGSSWELAAKLCAEMLGRRVLDGDASALSAAVWAAEAAEVPVALARGWTVQADGAVTKASAALHSLAKLQRKALRGAWRELSKSHEGGAQENPARSGLATAAQHFSAAYPPMAPPRRNPARATVRHEWL
ncbi:EMB2654 [Symbiodinium natans]|uniref:EMB2654 protein n=1 Tax=Symbiodinium natans TaxID=878477 RepID=A0A812U9G5_9DINO|nr:EMB2654 [Symbiodinium natans]